MISRLTMRVPQSVWPSMCWLTPTYHLQDKDKEFILYFTVAEEKFPAYLMKAASKAKVGVI